MKNKIVLFILGYKGFSVLNSIVNNGSTSLIYSVIIGLDKNIRNDYSNEIMALCSENKINSSFKLQNINKSIKYWVAIGWQRILTPPEGVTLLVIHDSLLPKYRGFSPLVNQLINGETLIGASCIIANKNYDEGDIIIQESFKVNYPIKIEKAIALMSKTYSKIFLDLIHQISSNVELKKSQQDESKATYSLWRDEEDYFINWQLDAKTIKRTIDALGNPYKGARTRLNEHLITIDDVIILPDLSIENRTVGKIIKFDNGFPVVVCGSGLLKILKANFIENGNSIFPLKKFRIRFS